VLERLDRAIALLERSLALLGEHPSPEAAGDLERNLGIALCQRGELDGVSWHAGVAHLERALALIDRAASPLPWSEVAGNLAIALRHLPDAPNASSNQQRALALLRDCVAIQQAHGAWSAWAGNQNNLANLLLQLPLTDRKAVVDEAIGAYEAALRVWTRGQNPHEWALTSARLAEAHRQRTPWAGRAADEAALALFDAALEVLAGHADRVGWSRVVNRRAGLLVDLARGLPPGEQIPRLRAALDDYDDASAVLDPAQAPVEWANIRNNAGLVHVSLADLAEDGAELRAAVREFEQVLRTRPRALAPLSWAQTTSALAGVLARLGRSAEAIALLEEAEPVAASAGAAGDVVRIARRLGSLHAAAQRWPAAAAACLRALEAAEQRFAAAMLRESRELEIAEVASLAAAAAYCFARADDATTAVDVLERGRARLLTDSLAVSLAAAAPATGDEDADARLREALATMRDGDAAMARLELEAEAAGPGGQRYRRLAEESLRSQRQAADAVLRLAGRRGATELHAQAGLELLDRPVVWMLLNPMGGLLLAYWRGQVEQVQVPGLTSERLEALLKGDAAEGPDILERQAAGSGRWGEAERRESEAMLRRVLPVVGGTLCVALSGLLARWGVRAVYLVACGRLGSLPIHAAPLDSAASPCCLADDVVVSYTPSRTVLRLAAAQARARAALPARLLAVVDTRGDLPMAGVEVADLQARAPVATQVIAGRAATRAAVLDASRDASHVHFACHGRTIADQPLLSRVELAGAEHLSLGDLVGELARGDAGAGAPLSKARLVVASACQTAVIADAGIPDEVVGLPAGFLQLGVPCYVGTLWPVPDLSSALFMTRFYERLLPSGNTPALAPDAALCETAVWLRELSAREMSDYLDRHEGLLSQSPAAQMLAERHPERRLFAEATHWASFVCMGWTPAAAGAADDSPGRTPHEG
jgi:CHAT domain-containing protein/tetratricopeptide (TPR) repeat protein